MGKKYKCAKCWEWKREWDFYKWKIWWKKRITSYCKQCYRIYKKWNTKKETTERAKKKYRLSYKWLVRQLIDDMLYKWQTEEAKKFRRTKEILKNLGEWEAEKYKKEYLLNVVKMNEKIRNWLYKWEELPELEVIDFILKNRRQWKKKEIKEKLELRRQSLLVGTKSS